MFGAETRLRQGNPAAALPYANAALVLIKQVQQSERIFVAHTGLQPPPIDESRRLTGKRDGVQRDGLALDAAAPADPAPAAAWRALADTPGATDAPDLAALERWLASDAAAGVDRLGFAADIDAARRDPRLPRLPPRAPRPSVDGVATAAAPCRPTPGGRRGRPSLSGRAGGPAVSASTWAAMGLGLITLIGWARLAGWARRTPRGPRRFGWRFAILLAAQPLLATLLYLTLFPPPGAGAPSGTLVAATRGAPRLAAIDGTPRIDLPETPPGAGGKPAPDLATALRRHPGATRLRVLGQGLEPRDRDAAAGLAIDFTPPPLAGLTQLQPPGRVAAGGAFKIGGRGGEGGRRRGGVAGPRRARGGHAAAVGGGRLRARRRRTRPRPRDLRRPRA